MVSRTVVKGMWRRRLALALGLILVMSACDASEPVTTEAEPIAQARGAWKSTYEKAPSLTIVSPEETSKFEPYTATLEDGVWIVRGTIPPGFHGDMLVTRIRVADGGGDMYTVRIN
jgi:hypothetical protein